jgi:hypothetical protein
MRIHANVNLPFSRVEHQANVQPEVLICRFLKKGQPSADSSAMDKSDLAGKFFNGK